MLLSPSDAVLLLCSDGLSDLVTSKQILSIVEANAGDPDSAAAALIAAANDSGGKDNITVVSSKDLDSLLVSAAETAVLEQPSRSLSPEVIHSFHDGLSSCTVLLRPS